ncbi:hypothetical protein ACYT6T_10570, partial [Streptococcus pyogenes]
TNLSSLDGLVRGKPAQMVNRYAIFAWAVYQKLSMSEEFKELTKSLNVPFDYYISAKGGDGEHPRRRRIFESEIIASAY